MTKIAVFLHGCGAQDGSEIHESVATLWALDKAGAEVSIYAPAETQARVIDHLSGEVSASKRSMIQEAARIARGAVRSIDELAAENFDGFIMPGGSGTIRNVCDFADKGAKMDVMPSLRDAIFAFHQQKKPIGAICIAPVVVARVLGEQGVGVTIGNDPDVARKIEEMGAKHHACRVDDCYVDEKNKVVTTPAYMLAQNIGDVFRGIEKTCGAVMRMTR